jgi:hypothetical protein
MYSCCTLQVMKGGSRTDPRHYDGGAALLIMILTLHGSRRLRCFAVADEASVASADGASVAVAAPTVAPDCVLNNSPGSVYCATLCGAEHQVQARESGEFADIQACIYSRNSLYPLLVIERARSKEGSLGIYMYWQTSHSSMALHAQVEHDADCTGMLNVPGEATPWKVNLVVRCHVFRANRGSMYPNPKPVFAKVQAVATSWLARTDLVWPDLASCMKRDAA